MDIKLKKDDFKFDLIMAFFLFAFLIIVIVTYVSIYFFTNIANKNFEQNVTYYAKFFQKEYEFKKISSIKKVIEISKSSLISNQFSVEENLLFSIFRLLLSSNENIDNISLIQQNKNIICNKKVCLIKYLKRKNRKNMVVKKKIENNNLIFEISLPVNDKLLTVVFKYHNFFAKYNMFNVMVIDKKGKIYYSDFTKSKYIYDMFGYPVVGLMENKEGFISDDIYVMNLNDKFKIVFLENKKLIEKTSTLSKKLAFIMIILSIFVAIPLGMFFSKPLYNYYNELDKRVDEEVAKVKEKEQLLMQQSKLAALGEMLGNIAHQWRHPLTHLSLLIQNMELAYKKNKLDEKYMEKFKKNSMTQINYMSKTIDDFRNFFKEDKEKSEFNVNEAIKEVVFLLEGRIKNNGIDIEITEKKQKSVFGFRNEFLQVIMNILNNAIDVLNERKIKNKKIWITIDNEIKIEDNAGGIEEDIIDKIFEPYFTTKFQSQGTGIGLYMSKIIITKHFQGDLFAYNSDNGAVFVVRVE